MKPVNRLTGFPDDISNAISQSRIVTSHGTPQSQTICEIVNVTVTFRTNNLTGHRYMSVPYKYLQPDRFTITSSRYSPCEGKNPEIVRVTAIPLFLPSDLLFEHLINPHLHYITLHNQYQTRKLHTEQTFLTYDAASSSV